MRVTVTKEGIPQSLDSLLEIVRAIPDDERANLTDWGKTQGLFAIKWQDVLDEGELPEDRHAKLEVLAVVGLINLISADEKGIMRERKGFGQDLAIERK